MVLHLNFHNFGHLRRNFPLYITSSKSQFYIQKAVGAMICLIISLRPSMYNINKKSNNLMNFKDSFCFFFNRLSPKPHRVSPIDASFLKEAFNRKQYSLRNLPLLEGSRRYWYALHDSYLSSRLMHLGRVLRNEEIYSRLGASLALVFPNEIIQKQRICRKQQYNKQCCNLGEPSNGTALVNFCL